MHCDHIDAEAVAQRYVSGTLAEAEQAGYERHYFDCPRCFDALQAQWALRRALGEAIDEKVAIATPFHRAWRPVAIAAGVVICAAAVFVATRQPAEENVTQAPIAQVQTPAAVPPPDLMALARVEPPPYVSLRVRGDEDRFEAAMDHYAKGDYTHAAEELRLIAARQPRGANVQLYLGVSELMLQRHDAAIAALAAAAREGSQAHAEHAHFLLAKAWLAQSRVPEARRELQACIALRGAHARQAADLLARLP